MKMALVLTLEEITTILRARVYEAERDLSVAVQRLVGDPSVYGDLVSKAATLKEAVLALQVHQEQQFWKKK